ncbi:secreted RxLR effector protein 161-like [Lactuca sativa]|uniref:secreted RxLR effector protein 161-like n=1 Tax=Lactuca sativa TaxID=4236 RepID=UPI0022AFDAF2|nr:secreted RxLR effector protein 161-like [Lactuca sativa]
MADPESDKWVEAMNGEMQSMRKNQVWGLVELPPQFGSIMYAIYYTKLDLAYAMSMISKFQQNPGESHWMVVKKILKYFHRTKDIFLVYGGVDESLSVKFYIDASLTTDQDDCKSESGYVLIVNGGAVSWKSSKKSVVAQFTTESKYIASLEVAQEVAWMKKFIRDLGVVPSIQDPLEVFYENEVAIALAIYRKSHKKIRHISCRFHFIRYKVEDGEIGIRNVHTDDNLVDPFMKALPQ